MFSFLLESVVQPCVCCQKQRDFQSIEIVADTNKVVRGAGGKREQKKIVAEEVCRI